MNTLELKNRLNNQENIVVPVESSNISTWAYNPITKKMTVLFKKKKMYQYSDVDIKTVKAFIDSHQESIGKAFNNLIANRFFYKLLRG